MEKRKETYYQSLYELAATLNSARAPNSILQSVVEGVAKTMGAKGCSLMLLSPDKKVLLHTVAYGLSTWYVRKGPVSADKSISEALEGKAVAILDATKDDRIQYREQAKKEGIASILSVPIMLREENIGVIRLYTAEPCHSPWRIFTSWGRLPILVPLPWKMPGYTRLFRKTTKHSGRIC
jgi:signal transduction protein with GAF and PtsI domain